MIAQDPHEGLELGDEGSTGLITNMPTDSTRIADEAMNGVREYLGQKYGEEYVPPKPRIYKTKASAQDAHEAIRPTATDRPPQKVTAYLTADQNKLYELIWCPFVASQMKSAQFDVTTVDVMAGE